MDVRVAKSREAPSERVLLLVVALGTILAPLNSTMIAVALPDLTREFHVGIEQTSWLVVSYLIAMAVIQPIAGRLGDQSNRRWIFLGALVGFLTMSVAAVFAPTFPFLVGLRIGQALCGALAIPNGVALVREWVPSARSGSAFGLIGAATGLAAGLGPPLGGAVVGLGGWRGIFLVNVPVVLLAFVIGWLTLPNSSRRATRSGFDLVGAVLLFAWLGSLALIPSSLKGSVGGVPRYALASFAAVAVVLFVWRETHVDQPVVHLDLFRVRAFAAAAAGVSFGNLAMYSTLLTIPQFVTLVLRRPDAEAGVVLAALSAPMAVLAPFTGLLADRWGRRPVAFAGGIVTVLGLGPLLWIGPSWSSWLLVAPLAAAGCGLALQSPAIQAAALEAAPVHQAGVASGVFSTSRYLGSITGSAVLAALLGAGAQPSASGLTAVFVMVVAAAVVAAGAAAMLPKATVKPSPVLSGMPR